MKLSTAVLIALTAILTMSIFVPQAVQAEGDKEDAWLTLEEEVGKMTWSQNLSQVLTRSGRTFDCEEAKLTASATNKATSITATPTYNGCTASLGPATIDMTGCAYIFHLEKTTTAEEPDYTAATSLECPAGKEVHIKIFTSHINHTAGIKACEFSFGDEHEGKPVNQELGRINLTNRSAGEEGTPKNWIEVHIELEKIHSTRTAGSTLLCGPLTDAASTLKGGAMLTAADGEGNPIGTTLSTDPGPKENASLTLEQATGLITGTQSTTVVFKPVGFAIDCGKVKFQAAVANGYTTINLIPEYDQCTWPFGPVTITMEGCSYTIHLEKTTTIGEDDYTATTDLSCPSDDEAHIKVYASHHNLTTGIATCEYSLGDEHEGVPVNQGLGHLDLTNKPADSETPKDWIEAHIDISGIHSRRTGGALYCGSSTSANGTTEGSLSLKATDVEGAPVGATLSTDPPF